MNELPGREQKVLRFLAALALSGGLAGCQDGQPARGDGGRAASLFGQQSGASEEWTVLCAEFADPDHRSICESFAVTLRHTPGIRVPEVACSHDDVHGVSQLTYGHYVRQVDGRTNHLSMPPQLVSDMNLLQDLGDDQGRRAFPLVRMIRQADSFDGPPEWALVNAPGGVYTLQIAVFYPERGFDEPRRAAVEMTRQLRSEGYEAYYHHSPAQSVVTVGTFGPQAAQHMRLEESTGRTRYAAEVETLRGRDERFQYNHQNGLRHNKILEGRKYPQYSFLVQIPRTQVRSEPSQPGESSRVIRSPTLNKGQESP